MVVRFYLLAAVALLGLSCLVAQANEGAGSGLATALRQHYKLATSKLDASGRLAFEPGTRLTVQKGGIMSFETNDASIALLCPSRVKGKRVRSSSDLTCTSLATVNRRPFKISETVCVTAIDVNESRDELSMVLLTCDPYNAVSKNKTDRAVLLFDFPKGTLGKATSAKIVDVIGQTLSEGRNQSSAKPGSPAEASAGKENPEAGDTGPGETAQEQDPPKPANSGASNNGEGDTGDDTGQPPSAGTPAPSGEPAQPAQPTPADSGDKAQQVTKGQTIEQVTAILGQPSSIADLRTKIVYFYPNLRVFFVDGKVTEVHRIGS